MLSLKKCNRPGGKLNLLQEHQEAALFQPANKAWDRTTGDAMGQHQSQVAEIPEKEPYPGYWAGQPYTPVLDDTDFWYDVVFFQAWCRHFCTALSRRRNSAVRCHRLPVRGQET